MARGIKDAIEHDKTVRFRISSEFYEHIKELAAARGVTFSQMARDILLEEIVKQKEAASPHDSDKKNE